MKKVLALILVFALALAIAGCGGGSAPSGNAKDVPSCKTLGEVIALGLDSNQTSQCGGYYVYVCTQGEDFYRLITKPDEKTYQAMWDLDWDDDKYEEKLQKLISPLEIIRYDHLNDEILSQSELDKYAGQKAQVLYDEGWTNWGWNLDDMEFWMNYGAFSYTAKMEGQVTNYDDFEEEDIADLTVKSITYNGNLGDATNCFDDDGNLID